jgi:ATP-dependent DNA ligase
MLLDNLARMGRGRSPVSPPRQQQVRTNVQALFGSYRVEPRGLKHLARRLNLWLAAHPPAMIVPRPSGFIKPCLPSKAVRPPSGPLWVHEIKHDGYRLMVRRDGARVRCFTKGGHEWADRFPAIVDAASRIQASSFLIDGEAVIARDDGKLDFHALRSRRRGAPGAANSNATFAIKQSFVKLL